jgi:RimJ/RimL family protein N-acetyltransferase
VIVVDGDEIGAYVGLRLGVTITPPFQAIGFLSDDKRPLAAFVFNDFNHSNMEMTIVAEPGGITRQVIRYVANYAFNTSKCRRLTVRTKKRNKHILKLAPRYGFKYECIAKDFYPDDDAVVFRMLKSDCRWL